LKYALWAAGYKLGAEVDYEIKYGEEILAIPIDKPFVGATAGMGTMYAISTFSKNPEAAIKFVEVMNTDKELYNMMCHGIEGTTFTKVGPNRIELIKDADDNYLYYPQGDWMFGNQFNAYMKPGQADDLWEKTDAMNRSATSSPARGFTADLEPVKDIQARVTAADKEYWNTEFLYIDDEEKYQALQEERKQKVIKAGVLKVHEEIQDQLIEWAKENGKPYEERVINWDPVD
jgi:putative aldouronate transport system substrate-binding protein